MNLEDNLPKDSSNELEDEETPRDSFEMIKKTEKEFNLGNDYTNVDDLTPKDILDEYREFN